MKTDAKKKKSIIIDVLLIVIIVALLETAAYLLYKQMNPNNTVIIKHEVTEDKSVNWDKLKAINPETVGWITIPGTNIDTPIVQTTDNDKYLNTSFQGEYDQHGVPFLDCQFKWEPRSRNSVIYGHSTTRTTIDFMFDAVVNYYDDPEMIKSHNEILYNRPEAFGGNGTYAIFAVLTVESDYDYRQMDFSNEDELVSYFNRIKAEAYVKRDDISVAPGDEILTLSTCNGHAGLKDGRTALVAKRIK